VGNGRFYQTVNVDVDIDSSVLEENGYHHEDDCEKLEIEVEVEMAETRANRENLRDWHDQKHGLTLWTSCTYDPCTLLSDAFKNI
jgi:hypothetical protein